MFLKKKKTYWYIYFLLFALNVISIVFIITNFSLFSENFFLTKNVYPKLPKDNLFIVFSIVLWFILNYFTNVTSPKKNITTFKKINALIKHGFFYLLFILSYFGFLKVEMSRKMIFLFVTCAMIIIPLVNFITLYLIQVFKKQLNKNYTDIIIIGMQESTEHLVDFFTNKNDNYKIKATFNFDPKNKDAIEKSFRFIKENEIDEIYCSLENLENNEINQFINIADEYNATIKFIPNKDMVFGDNVSTSYYGFQPVFSLKTPSLNNVFNQLFKRLFDVIFSLLIIVFVLSWLIPLLYIIIKLETKGPLFYKHIRYGINYKEFYCFKFRSLKQDDDHNVLDQVKKGDERVTKIGKFLRKTSIDELPQFINVFLGDMSVVGPRPHMIPYSNLYSKYFDKYKYIYRHSVKPGITGLAQIKGFRGETESESDIVNRVKYDIYYIENWSFFLDLKIIMKTIINTIKGDEKAY